MQPVPGNLQEENLFTIECSHNFLGNRKTMFEKLVFRYLSVVLWIRYTHLNRGPIKIGNNGVHISGRGSRLV